MYFDRPGVGGGGAKALLTNNEILTAGIKHLQSSPPSASCKSRSTKYNRLRGEFWEARGGRKLPSFKVHY